MKRWGARPITDVTPEEVAAAIRAIVKRGAQYQAHNALGYIRRLFNWAIGTHEFGIRTSPIAQLKPKDLIGKREARERTLSDEELRVVWMAAGEELVIAHAKPGLHKVYDQHAYQSEKRHCLSLWEKRLISIVEPRPGGMADLAETRERKRAEAAT